MPESKATAPVLYSYWRSSSSYRVRIALNLKGIDYEQAPVHLVRNGGEQNHPAYREINPLGLVPALVHDGRVMVQSLAICEYLEEAFPHAAAVAPRTNGAGQGSGALPRALPVRFNP